MKNLMLMLLIVLAIILGGPASAALDHMLEKAFPWSVR